MELVGLAAVGGEYEGEEAKHELVSGQSTQKDQEPPAEMREVWPWEDTTLTGQVGSSHQPRNDGMAQLGLGEAQGRHLGEVG